MSPYDCYPAAKKIAHDLSEAGYPDWGDRITDAIAAGFTSTEILMNIRWQLEEFLKSKVAISRSLELAVSDLIKKIDEAFKQAE